MWILWSVIASLAIAIALSVARVTGDTFIKGYIFYMLAVSLGGGWAVPVSYAKAPTLYHAFFLQTGLLTFFMLLIGHFYFQEVMSLRNWFGAALLLGGSCLLFNGG